MGLHILLGSPFKRREEKCRTNKKAQRWERRRSEEPEDFCLHSLSLFAKWKGRKKRNSIPLLSNQ